jgi:hypothetical protein
MGRILMGLALLVASTTWAQAYLDPGTGSLILQLILGGAIAATAAIKLYWERTKDIVRRIFGAKTEPPSQV